MVLHIKLSEQPVTYLISACNFSAQWIDEKNSNYYFFKEIIGFTNSAQIFQN